jgi:hypothetical protein
MGQDADMHRRLTLRPSHALAALAALVIAAAACGDTEPPKGEVGIASEPSVAFASPHDGDAVANPVEVAFEAHGFALEPAGEVHDDAGHLHVMVDVPCVEPGQAIPRDASHVHFGMGQSEGRLDLEAGTHTLCLQAGDGTHTALDLTDEITIEVDDTPSVAFLEPASGAQVTSPVAVRLAAFNLALEPAGEVHDHAGHLHLMVDVPCVEPGQPIPRDDQHVHLGQGQAETSLTLPPGEHTLCLQAGDGVHAALPATREVTFTVS